MTNDTPPRSPASEDKRKEDTSKPLSENGSRKEKSPARLNSRVKQRSSSVHSTSSNKSGQLTSTASKDTNSTDPDSVRCRVFIGNLNTDKVGQEDLVDHFGKFGKVTGCSLHMNYGFVQYGSKDEADKAVAETHGIQLFGKRVDANIASERRRSGKDRKGKSFGKDDEHRGRSRRRSRSRSPQKYRSRSPMSRYDELYRRDDPLGRSDDGRSRDFYDKRNDYFDSRDSYSRSGDHYGRDPYSQGPHVPKTADCEIIAMSGDLKVYGESIQTKLRAMGISANLMFPPPEVSVLEIVDRMSRSGSLYAVVITSQNMFHKSCTLNVLHGAAQEHRNMPLDDALAFVARNFNQHLGDSRDRRPTTWQAPSVFPRSEDAGKTILTQDPYISGILNMAAAGRPLKVVEVNHLIEALIKYKNDIEIPEGKEMPTHRAEERQLAHIPGADSIPPRSQEAYEDRKQFSIPPTLQDPYSDRKPYSGDVLSVKESQHAPQSQSYYNPQPQSSAYSYETPSSTVADTYLGYLGYGTTKSAEQQPSAYAAKQPGTQQGTSSSHQRSGFVQGSTTQQMSGYPSYYNAS